MLQLLGRLGPPLVVSNEEIILAMFPKYTEESAVMFILGNYLQLVDDDAVNKVNLSSTYPCPHYSSKISLQTRLGHLTCLLDKSRIDYTGDITGGGGNAFFANVIFVPCGVQR